MRIYLVRHGQSRSNLDWTENQRVADHAIELTEEGHRQASAAGEWLRGHLLEHVARGMMPLVRMWLSPYARTRQTATAILEQMKSPIPFLRDLDPHVPLLAAGTNLTTWPPARPKTPILHAAGTNLILDHREHLMLAEQQFGLFDGLADWEREAKYPAEFAYYEKCKKFEGKLWPQMPLGESRFEVCQRVHQAFGTFKRDAEKHGIDTIVVVAHGTVNRAFTMMWLHKPYEWMHEETNPNNCSIRLLADGEDMGYVFEGFPNSDSYKHASTKETEE